MSSAKDILETKELDTSDPALLKLRDNPLNLTKSGTVIPGDYRIAITLGLPFIGNRASPDNQTMGKDTIPAPLYTLARRFLFSLQNSPNVTDVMWPVDGSTTADTNNIFSAGLKRLMSDHHTFVDFAPSGFWSDGSDIKEALTADGAPMLSSAAATLFTTSALRQNGYKVVVPSRKSTDPQTLGEGCTTLDNNVGMVCPDKENEAFPGSAARFWSGNTQRVYNLIGDPRASPRTTNAVTALMDIYNEGYADLWTMFDGGFDCTSEGHVGALLGVYSDGQLAFECFSSLPFEIPSRTATMGAYGAQGK
ncbi:MAG: hypothetical protein Q9166_006201 [cf. Caloplaca sp. 2 TL-2023]